MAEDATGHPRNASVFEMESHLLDEMTKRRLSIETWLAVAGARGTHTLILASSVVSASAETIESVEVTRDDPPTRSSLTLVHYVGRAGRWRSRRAGGAGGWATARLHGVVGSVAGGAPGARKGARPTGSRMRRRR